VHANIPFSSRTVRSHVVYVVEIAIHSNSRFKMYSEIVNGSAHRLIEEDHRLSKRLISVTRISIGGSVPRHAINALQLFRAALQQGNICFGPNMICSLVI
jgi:hypothetical protein